jgi:Protein of unknown function (DUF1569)
MALRLPAKWPHGVKTRPQVEQGVGGTAPLEFEQIACGCSLFLSDFAGSQQATATHPVFGPMSRKEWLRWGYLHADHHLHNSAVS